MVEVIVRPGVVDESLRRRVKRAVEAVLRSEGAPAEAELSIVLTDDAEIQSLNRQYRGIDAPTDVLSFGQDPEQMGFVDGSEEPPYLGDIVISVPRVREQAAEAGNEMEPELSLVVVHGVLHLLGYDHDMEKEEALMWERQDAILHALRSDLDG